MKMIDYLEQSGRTAAKLPEGIQCELFATDAAVVADLNFITAAGNIADSFKRAIFYGSPVAAVEERLKNNSEETFLLTQEVLQMHNDNHKAKLNDQEIDLVHGLYGIVSEAGELAEAVQKAFRDGQKIDVVNAREEIGDMLWYVAMMLRAINSNFEEAAGINIDKLSIRYPEKFTKENAINRDLQAEKIALEQ